MRPNSPPQTTSVSSSRPRCFRSVTQRGRRLVGVAALVAEVAAAGCRAGPSRGGGSARSARRARPAGGPAGSWRRTCRASSRRGRTGRASPAAPCDRSVSSGTLVCMRNAISYCAMRVCVSGSPSSSKLLLVQLAERVEHARGGRRRRRRAGSAGTAPDRRRCAARRRCACVGRKPLPHMRVKSACAVAASASTSA